WPRRSPASIWTTSSTSGSTRRASRPRGSSRIRGFALRSPAVAWRARYKQRARLAPYVRRYLRIRRRQREGQDLRVAAGAQRVIRADRLLEAERHHVIGDRRIPGLRHAADLQRLRQRERAVDEVPGVGHVERRVARGRDHVRGRLRGVVLRRARLEL